MEKKDRRIPPLVIPYVLVITALVVLSIGRVHIQRNATAKRLNPQLIEMWKNTPSDIEGMSKWDKYDAGMVVVDGSDTDSDGLTDREEMEIYHTNPLKASTAGDLFTDGYKISVGMNPDKKYDYDGVQYFPHNDCDEVILSAENPLDFNAVVTPCEGITEYLGLKVYAAYQVYNYSGKLSIDLADVMHREGIRMSDINIYVSNGTDVERYRYAKDGTIATLRKKLSADTTYMVYCAEDNFLKFAVNNALSSGVIDTVTNAANSLTGSDDTDAEPEEVEGDCLIVMSPMLTVMCKTPVIAYYEDLGDDVKNEQLQHKVEENLITLMGESSRSALQFHVKRDNAFLIKGYYHLLQEYIPICDFSTKKSNEFDIPHFFLLFYSYDKQIRFNNGETNFDDFEGVTDKEDDKDRPATDTVSGFHPQWDTLPFGNFGTPASKSGHCAGIAHLTAYLYNRDTFPARSSAASWDSEHEWNLLVDKDNATLCDPGLRSYQYANFIADRVHKDGLIHPENLPEGEAAFFTMIHETYIAANENAEFICEDLIGGDFGKIQQDYSVIESAMQFLESGKILTVYMDMVDGSRHAVNIYDYRVSESNPNVVSFRVYDSNFPDERTGKYDVSDTGFQLVVEKQLKRSGDGYTFSYKYFPIQGKIKGKTYGASSNPQNKNGRLFLIVDEMGHLIND